MSLAAGLELAAKNYSQWADNAEKDAATDKAKASWLHGRAGVFRQAAIDFRTLANIAEQVEGK